VQRKREKSSPLLQAAPVAAQPKPVPVPVVKLCAVASNSQPEQRERMHRRLLLLRTRSPGPGPAPGPAPAPKLSNTGLLLITSPTPLLLFPPVALLLPVLSLSLVRQTIHARSGWLCKGTNVEAQFAIQTSAYRLQLLCFIHATPSNAPASRPTADYQSPPPARFYCDRLPW
jgi:hypothetical protein